MILNVSGSNNENPFEPLLIQEKTFEYPKDDSSTHNPFNRHLLIPKESITLRGKRRRKICFIIFKKSLSNLIFYQFSAIDNLTDIGEDFSCEDLSKCLDQVVKYDDSKDWTDGSYGLTCDGNFTLSNIISKTLKNCILPVVLTI